MSQGQVPRVLRKGAKIVAATKSPPPQTSACLSHGGGVERGALCPVSLCGMGHPGGLHSSPRRSRPVRWGSVACGCGGECRGRRPELFTLDLRRQAVGHGGKHGLQPQLPHLEWGWGVTGSKDTGVVLAHWTTRASRLCFLQVPPDSRTLDSRGWAPSCCPQSWGQGCESLYQRRSRIGLRFPESRWDMGTQSLPSPTSGELTLLLRLPALAALGLPCTASWLIPGWSVSTYLLLQSILGFGLAFLPGRIRTSYL